MTPSVVVVINLARRPDRLVATLAQLDEMDMRTPVVVHTAQDGGPDRADAARACYVSHRAVLADCPAGALVLEDDVVLLPELRQVLDVEPPPGWWLARLAGLIWPAPPGWYQAPTRHSHAYLVQHPGKVLAALESVLHVDVALNRVPHTWTRTPAVVGQDPRLGSDITGWNQ